MRFRLVNEKDFSLNKGGRMKPYNRNINDTLELSRQLMFLADKGDMERDDDGCGVLYGIVRDIAYRIKAEAEREIECHRKKGKWEEK
jgi:hypothetical protein